MNGAPRATLRVAPAGSAPSANAPKVDPNDPQVRKLVYNAYREMLSKKHTDANVIVDSAPQEFVTHDQGIGSRVESMMRQQSELKGGNMNAGGPPPPPPPPPIPGIIPTSRLPSEIPARPAMNNPPSALASAMMKDRKPFTYTPGGLDLSEIRSPRMQRRLYRNAQSEGVKPSPLAQQPHQGQPNAAASAQCAPQGLPIQVLPMPGVGMGPQHQSQPKEAPKPKKNMCGPAPPPPPFVVTAENSFTMPVSSPISSVPSTISSPPISSSPTSPGAPQPMLAKEPGPSIPMAPPLPTQNFAARRGSLFSASPPSSPLVSTIPCEPSPPPLPPPQAVRVPVTPPIVQESSSPPQPILPKEIEIPSPPVVMSLPETILSPKAAELREITPVSVVEDNIDLPIAEESPYLPKSTSTPIQDIILGYPETDNSRPADPILSSSHDLPQELILMPNEVSCKNDFSSPENSLDKISPQKENLLSSDSQSSFTESSPNLDEAYELIPEIQPSKRIKSPSINHEPSPIYLEEHTPITPLATKSSPAEELALLREIPRKEPTPFSRETTPTKQVGVKELTPVKQVYIKETTPVKQAPVKEPTPEMIPLVKELTPVKLVPVKEPASFNPAPFKEPTPEKLVFEKELTPIKNVPVKEPTPVQQVSIKEPVPVQLAPIKEPMAVQQVPIEELDPGHQVTVKDSTPIRQILFDKPVIKQAPIKEQYFPPKSELNDLSAIKHVPTRQAGVDEYVDNEVPVIFSPIPVKEMPLKEPTPVRQISREPTPVRQAILEQPIFKDTAPMFPFSVRPNAPSRPTPTQPLTGFGNSVPRQVPAQVAGLKRQSSLPEPPFIPNIPLEPPPFITQMPDMQLNQSSVPKPNLSKQNSLSQPLPIKPIPIRTNNEMDVNRARVKGKSPPPALTLATAVNSASAAAKGTHVVSQSSLPTKPSSQVSTPNKHLGASNDVPPHAEEEISNSGPMSPSGERSPRRSPTTGLHRAPLPWMCGHLREPSPPPLFVQRAQQTSNRFQPHNRFIRQSSLGPESSTETFPRAGTMTQPNTRHQPVFQRQQSLPPPQKPQQQQQQSQALPARIQQQYRPQQPQMQNQPHLVQTQQPPLQPQSQVQYQPRPIQTQQPKLQPQTQVRQPHTFESQTQQPHSNHIQSQPKSHPIRIQHQGYLNQQPRVIPVQVQQSQQPKQKPKERIIPIMIESDSPPREIPPAPNHTASSSTTFNTNASANERFIPIRIEGSAATNNAQHTFQQPLPYLNQQQQQQNLPHPRPSWNSSSGTAFKNPINTLSGSGQSGAFLPYNSLSSSSSENSSNNNNNNSNPLDALHQMQQSLAQLNSGLENAFPRFIQKKMSDTITPRTTPSNQYPNQNGDQADMGPPVQSRSFRVLQNVLDHQDNADIPTSGSPMKVEVPLIAPRPYSSQLGGVRTFASSPGPVKRGSLSQSNGQRETISKNFNEKRGSFSGQGTVSSQGPVSQGRNERNGTFQQSVGAKRGSVPNISKNQVPSYRPNGYRGSVGNIRNASNQENNLINSVSDTDGLKIIQHSVGGVSKIVLGQNGETEPASPDAKELPNIFRNQVRISANTDEARARGGHFPKENFNSGQKMEQGLSTSQALSENKPLMSSIQNVKMPQAKEAPTASRFFRRLQTITDTLPEGVEPQGPIHIPSMKHAQQPSQYQTQPQQFQQQHVYQQQSGVNNEAATTEQAVPEPKKYMGGNIPSRSFRMLQAMTGSDDATDAGEPANTSESSSHPDDDTLHTANQIPSPNCKSSIPNSPSSLTSAHDNSSDSGISSPSKIGSYTIGKDSKVYRHVSPKVIFNGSKDRVVNSALSNSREPSSPTWKTVNPHPIPTTVPVNRPSQDSANQDSPRLMKIIQGESVAPNPPIECIEKRYEGGHIPSRVFRHLQAEYSSGDPNELQEPMSQYDSKTPSPCYNGSPIPPRVLKSLQNTSFDSDVTDGDNPSRASSSLAELDEYYHNGVARTAVTKDTVLKELTAQFDHTGVRKKPKAAPGRVFRYLQSQYDTPEDCLEQQNSQTVKDTLKPEPEDNSGFGFRGAKVPSPSFKFLQSQYSQEQEQVNPSESEPSYPDTPELKEEPLPYRGCRVPGRTFRSLQDNVTTHPSVLKPRK
ncbi:mucin-2-like isoform X18 [Palaemon carinicauda]|uniref:mucin-2-like isoform X18 n=1 Tax=Palaemon carinicauda TaxID=392227 RepID=UPI0035B60D3B